MRVAGPPVQLTFEGLCYILKPKPVMGKNEQTLKQEIQWWPTSQKL